MSAVTRLETADLVAASAKRDLDSPIDFFKGENHVPQDY